MFKRAFMTIGLILAMLTTQFTVSAQVDAPIESSDLEYIEVIEEDSTEQADAVVLVDDEDPKNLGNIFEFKYLKIDEVEHVEGTVVEITHGMEALLYYEWHTENLGVKAGDYSEIRIPDAFDILANIPAQNIIVGGHVVGTYTIIDNILRVEFNENVDKVGDISNGYIGFGASFDETIFNEDVITEIQFNDQTDKKLTIVMPPTVDVKQIDKSGEPDANKDAKKITWTINVSNPSGEDITEANIKDLIPEGLELDPSSITLEHLTIGKDGSLNKTGEFVESFNPTLDGNKFSVSIDKMGAYKGYQLTYTTNITDFSIKSFTNEASLNYEDKTLPASATVSGIERSDLIEKRGNSINKGDQISWTIDVNKAGSTINNAIVEDNLPEFTTLTPGSIEVYELVKQGNNWIEKKLDLDFDQFPIALGDIADGARRIKFKTDVDYTLVNGGIYEGKNDFINNTTLKDGETPLDEDQAKVTTQRESIITKNGSANINYDTKEINWTISVNKANHAIGNAIINDIMPDGLKLIQGSVKVFKGEEDITSAPTTEIVETPDNLEVHLGDIDTEHTITFKTTIDDFSIENFTNTGTVGGEGVGENGNTDDKTVTPNRNSFSKKYESIDYENKTSSWKLTANPILESIKDLEIVDRFPNKGLVLLEKTLVVKLGSEELTEGTDYTLSPRTLDSGETSEGPDTGYHLGFVLKFKGPKLPLNNLVTITYKTTFDPNIVVDQNTSTDENREYKNEAHFIGKTSNNHDINSKKEDKVSVREEAWNTGRKTGKLISIDKDGNRVNGWVSGNERRLEWTVYANYLEQNLEKEVVFKDTLGYSGTVDIENIQVLTYTVNQAGDITPGEATSLDYTVSATSDGFTLKFTGDVNERFAVVFTTSVDKLSQKQYTNTANTTAKNHNHDYSGTVAYDKGDNHLSKKALNADGENVYTDQELDWNILLNENLSIVQSDIRITDTISDGHVYKSGSFKLYRYDGTSRVEANPDNYTFRTTLNEKGLTVLELVFKSEMTKKYEMEYTTVVTAETGKINNKVEFEGKNTTKYEKESKELTAKQFSFSGGDPSKGRLHVEKFDDNKNLITEFEAGFDLLYKVNPEDPNEEFKRFGNQTFSTKDGKVEITNIPLNRTYFLQEVSAPEGHLINEEPIEIKITKPAGKENRNAYEVSVVNKIIRGDIQLVKKDNEGNLLEGVSFTIHAVNDSEFVPIKVTSNKQGLVEFKDIPYGDYIIKEVSPLTGYIMDEREIPVTVVEDSLLIKLDDVTNTKIRGSVRFAKFDNEETIVEGAEFGIFSADKPNILIKKVFSDDEGIVQFDNLEYGDYVIKETRPADGYIGTDEIFTVSIDTHEKTVALDNVKNTKIRGNIKLLKKDNEGKIVTGAEFTIYKANDTNFENPVDVVESDANGLVEFMGIAYGSYIIKETSVPTGYLPLLNEDGSEKVLEVDIVRNN